MQRLKTKITLCYFYTFYHGGKGIVNMSEYGLERRVNELHDCTEEQLLEVLEKVDTRILFRAVWNEIERLQKLEADMQKLFNK